MITVEGERGKYVIVGDSGGFARGRTSVCFKAQSQTDETVCVKVFTEDPISVSGSDAATEFRAELRARQALQHPHILPVLDTGVVEAAETRPFVVLPLCEHDLRATLKQQQFLPLMKALPFLTQIAQAVDFAHSHGVIHGDIKPENILFVRSDTHAYLTDFGTARFFSFHETMATRPQGGSPAGTTAYLSPEQLESNHQTLRSDIYSLALVAYETLTGHLPFDPALPPYRQMQAKVEGRPRDPRLLNPSISKRVAQALLRGLDASPEKRPASASELCNSLLTESGTSTTERSEDSSESNPSNGGSGSRITILVAIIGVVGTLGGALFTNWNQIVGRGSSVAQDRAHQLAVEIVSENYRRAFALNFTTRFAQRAEYTAVAKSISESRAAVQSRLVPFTDAGDKSAAASLGRLLVTLNDLEASFANMAPLIGDDVRLDGTGPPELTRLFRQAEDLRQEYLRELQNFAALTNVPLPSVPASGRSSP